MMNLVVCPIACAISALFGARDMSLSRCVIYFIFAYATWKYVYGRYSKSTFMHFIEKYSKREPFRLPAFIIGVIQVISFFGGFWLAGRMNALLLKFNLIGCFGNFL